MAEESFRCTQFRRVLHMTLLCFNRIFPKDIASLIKAYVVHAEITARMAAPLPPSVFLSPSAMATIYFDVARLNSGCFGEHRLWCFAEDDNTELIRQFTQARIRFVPVIITRISVRWADNASWSLV